MRRIGYASIAVTLVIAGLFTAFAVSGTTTTATVTACVTVPAQTISANGTRVGVVAAKSGCTTVSYTVPTTTETVTTTVATTAPPVTTTAPATTTAPVTTTPTTTTQPPSQATLFVSPTGKDTNPCSQAAPCQSFARAYAVAANGAVIDAAPGTYPAQFFSGGANASDSPRNISVTFKGEPGNVVRQVHSGGDNITYDGINIDAGGTTTTGAAFENGGGTNTRYLNGSIGNVVDEKGALVDGSGLVFDNVTFHDVLLRTAGVHTECLYAEVPEGMVIRNSRFSNCAVMDVFFKYPDWWVPLPPPYNNVTLDGNTFGAPDGTYAAYVTTQVPVATAMQGWRVSNNVFQAPVNIDEPVGSGNSFCGNSGHVDASWTASC